MRAAALEYLAMRRALGFKLPAQTRVLLSYVEYSEDRGATTMITDLAVSWAIDTPLTGHTRSVNTVAVAQLDGRPVVISGGGDRTVRVWDLGTGNPTSLPISPVSQPTCATD